MIVIRNVVFTSVMPLGSSPIGLKNFCMSCSAANQVFAQSFFNLNQRRLPAVTVSLSLLLQVVIGPFWLVASYLFDWLN